jgi:prolyl oligopeptidase
MRDAKLILLGAALLVGCQVWAATDNTAAPAIHIKKPPAARIKPVTETLWGRKVTDNYRYMEALDPSTLSWMKAQGAYTRSVLDSIRPLARLKTEVAQFSASVGLIKGYVLLAGRAFYEERTPGSDNFDLIVSDSGGTRKIVDMAALRAANGGNRLRLTISWLHPMAARSLLAFLRAALKMRH